MPNADLIRTFAQTFGLPYTPARQNLPALADNCHLHLGKLTDFYHHLDSTWQGENPRADYWLGMQTLFLQWLPYAGLPEIWHDWAFGWNNKAKQYLPIDGWREEWAVFGNMFDDSILFADTAAPNSPVYWLMTGYGRSTPPPDCTIGGCLDANTAGHTPLRTRMAVSRRAVL